MSVFADVRVLDFSNDRAAAMAAMHLGDLGAEVIKVDRTARERAATSRAIWRGTATSGASCWI